MIEYKGKMYARVSNILNRFSDFSHIPPEVLQRKQDIGTSVHKAIEDDINGEFPCPVHGGRGYYHSYEAWKKQMNPKIVRSEERFYCNEKMITGQIDALIHYPGNYQIPMMVDFKTSAQESKETWPMQAHLYAYLLAVNGILVHPKYLFMKLDKNGELPQVFEYLWSQNTHAKCMNAVDDFWKKEAEQ